MQYLLQAQDEYLSSRGKFHNTRIRCYSPTPQPPPTGGEGGGIPMTPGGEVKVD